MAKTLAYNFFATRNDILSILQAVEASYLLQYVRCGLFDEADPPVFRGFASLPIGRAQTGQSVLEPTFLVMSLGDRLIVRKVPQRRGGTKYAVDQKANPGTITIRAGGLYNESALIAGMAGTIHDDEKSARLMNAFSRELEGGFTKVKSYLVGPEARKLYSGGMRLTRNVGAPAELDLSA